MTGKRYTSWNRRKPNHRRRSIKPNQKGTGASLMRIIFSGTTACDRYKKKIPQAVKDDYMAGEVEIFETAQRLVKKYKQSQQFRYVLVKRPQIRETDGENFKLIFWSEKFRN